MEAGEPHGKDLVFERDFDDRYYLLYYFAVSKAES